MRGTSSPVEAWCPMKENLASTSQMSNSLRAWRMTTSPKIEGLPINDVTLALAYRAVVFIIFSTHKITTVFSEQLKEWNLSRKMKSVCLVNHFHLKWMEIRTPVFPSIIPAARLFSSCSGTSCATSRSLTLRKSSKVRVSTVFWGIPNRLYISAQCCEKKNLKRLFTSKLNQTMSLTKCVQSNL